MCLRLRTPEGRRGRKSAKFRESSLRAIFLCPTPCDRRRADSWGGGAFRRRTFALLSTTKGAESASHLAASEQCVLRTAGSPKSRPGRRIEMSIETEPTTEESITNEASASARKRRFPSGHSLATCCESLRLSRSSTDSQEETFDVLLVSR